MARLEGKVALITGAAKGLGESDARLFVKEGAKVVLTDIDSEQGKNLADELGKDSALFLEQDVRDEDRWKEVLEQTVQHFGKLNILVNNAGIVIPGNIETQSTDEYRLIMSVHVDSVFFGSKYAIPHMIESGSGSIINMASIAAIQGERYVVAYCAAKAAITGLTRATAVHCAQEKHNIRANCIAPSGMDTPMVQNFGAQMLEAGLISGNEASSPSGKADDIGYMALYLASDESKFVSGTTMVVDNSTTITTGAVPS
jgi:3(or 17)beta-hydroxysteroid dehydrogenase|tara:strand:+ start:2585 stop:3355 length:771 start_codon:yes stop_codon:yes gene_type:complete